MNNKIYVAIISFLIISRWETLPPNLDSYIAYAAGSAADDLIIEDPSGSYPEYVTYLRNLFYQHAWPWTEDDLGDIYKIIIVKDQRDMGGALGLYDNAKVYDASGKLTRWVGIIYIWGGAAVGKVLAHEYGHHFTSYWAAMRTNGAWYNHWPADSAGDYYTLRPLPAQCSCESDTGCEYHLNIWEIIAEDFRTTVTTDPALKSTSHLSANEPCPGTTMTVGYPNPVGVPAYLRALPLFSPIPTPEATLTIAPTVNLTITPVVLSPTAIYTVTPTSSPTVTLSPTIRPTIPCPTYESDYKSIKLGVGPPCYAP